jgi:hypothetical protein
LPNSTHSCARSTLAGRDCEMSEAHELARIARDLGELQQVAHYQGRQTSDQSEELIAYWNDTRARDFALSHDEPMRSLMPGLQRHLAEMNEIASRMEAPAFATEDAVRRVFGERELVVRLAAESERHLETARYHISDANELARQCQTANSHLRWQLHNLGSPPV